MKRIGLISDTHGWLDDAVFKYFAQCDEVWHAGDIGTLAVLEALENFKPTKAVFGNIDGAEIRRATVENLRWNCEGLDVLMTHIGGRPGNYSKNIRDVLKQQPPQLFICGHSHICLAKMDAKMGFLHLNPGAAGRHGFHHVRTLMRFSVSNGKVQNLEVIELGPRSERML